MARFNGSKLPKAEALRISRQQTNDPGNASLLDLGTEGVCPKTGDQMIKVRLTACSVPQTVWYSERSRVALPMSKPSKL